MAKDKNNKKSEVRSIGLKSCYLHGMAILQPVFLLPALTASPQLRPTQHAEVSHLVTGMQNDSTTHNTLIAPFIQEHPSPLQTKIKLLLLCDTPFSSLYRQRSTEPRRVSLPRSHELVTAERNSQHPQLSQHPRPSLPMMPDRETHGKPRVSIFLTAPSHLAP